MGMRARNSGVQDIFIGGVPVRSRQYSDDQLYELNVALESLCQRHNFIYIDNSEITLRHLSDGVHLNTAGTKILANNYLEAIRVHYGGWFEW